eukprot:11873880-Alexandrium_andersonii.AAC.1
MGGGACPAPRCAARGRLRARPRGPRALALQPLGAQPGGWPLEGAPSGPGAGHGRRARRPCAATVILAAAAHLAAVAPPERATAPEKARLEKRGPLAWQNHWGGGALGPPQGWRRSPPGARGLWPRLAAVGSPRRRVRAGRPAPRPPSADASRDRPRAGGALRRPLLRSRPGGLFGVGRDARLAGGHSRAAELACPLGARAQSWERLKAIPEGGPAREEPYGPRRGTCWPTTGPTPRC